MEIRIDDEFKDLIPALSAEEYAGLEESVLRDGCRDALVLWGDTLVDGHNRYEICRKHGIPFRTVQKEFSDRNAAIVWMIQNQLARRNLPAYERARLALRLKPAVAEKAREKMLSGKSDPEPNLAQGRAEQTRDTIAHAAGVSHGTLAKVEKLEAVAPPEMKQQLRTGELSINQAYQSLKHQNGDGTGVPAKPHIAYNSGNNEWYTPSEYIEAAREVMGSIDLDPASSEIANEVVKAKAYYTAEDDGLTCPWFGNIWLNPPYAADLIGQFIDALVGNRENYHQAIVLVNNATETRWFTSLVEISSAIIFPASRVKFYMPDGKTGAPLQGQAVAYIGDEPERFLEIFSRFGWGMKPWRMWVKVWHYQQTEER